MTDNTGSDSSEASSTGAVVAFNRPPQPNTVFDRRELNHILDLYGRMVADGEWRDYAIDFGRDRAVFSVFRRAAEVPLYRIVKDSRLRHKQGLYSAVAATGAVLKRGHDLQRVLAVIDKRPTLVRA
ncbi:MAG: hypothetical protein BGP06_20365 [Rhizobiales bacterium 65-9]|nr:DUF2794 domain-containing protein [Hyphomicrobiales bacterium]OJY38790.1 MAG: hypothetical protein BGP06_20365 [Rhizobiales bacterium 65-9]